jgi:hypothetical protein
MAEKKITPNFHIGLFAVASSTRKTNHPNRINLFSNKKSYRITTSAILLLVFVSFTFNNVIAQAQTSFQSKKRTAAPVTAKLSFGEFLASPFEKGNLLRWQTNEELNIVGFHIYREENGSRVLVNQQLIPGSAFRVGADVPLQDGHRYELWDKTDNHAATYWVETLDGNGNSRWQGPFEVTKNESSALLAAINHVENLSLVAQTSSLTMPVEPLAKLPVIPLQNIKTLAATGSDPGWKFDIKKEGWYVITQPELLAAGFDPKTNPKFLQLFVDNEQQPIYIKGQEDSKLDAADTIEFYGQGVDSPFCSARKYWLTKGRGQGLRISASQALAAPTAGGSFPYRVERKDRTLYFSSLLNGDKENFFGAAVSGAFVDQSINIQHLDASASQTASLKVALQGVTYVSHIVDVAVNDNPVGQLFFEWQQSGEESFTFSSSFLREGENKVTLTPRGGSIDISLVDSLRLTYPHTYTADNNYLRVTASGGQPITIWGFSNEFIETYDVTSPSNVQNLKGQITKRTTGGVDEYAISLILPKTGERQILAMSRDKVSRVGNLCADAPSALKNTNQSADLVIITRKDLQNAISPLVSLRQKQKLSVQVVSVEDIYDEFCYGQKSPQAIKDFLYFANTYWRNPVRYAIFFGDSSYDPKEYLGFGPCEVVPTKLIDTNFMETASDDWLSDFNGDGIADVAIGRLPARNANEASAMVAKLIAYANATPSNEVLMVSDIPDVFDFESTNASLVPLLPAGSNVTFVKRTQMSDSDARNAILEKLNQGPRIVNYVGHGTMNQWRGNLFMSADALTLQNNQSYPVFVMMNCLNGFYQDPVMEGLAESLLKAPQGGAVAAWASSALVFAEGQAEIDQEFYRLNFSGLMPGITIGEAAMKAKLMTYDQDIRRTWILFGDPSMRFK